MAVSEVDEKISEYASYFEEVLCATERMGEIKCGSVPALQQMLYLNVLDTFAGDAFPDCHKNGERFVQFIDKISGWEYCDRVSTTRLVVCLEAKKLQNKKLYARVSSHFPPDNQAKTIKDDYCSCGLLDLAECENEKVAIEECRFPKLIWKYRNSLSHEFTVPSKANDVAELEWSDPRYLSCSNERSLVFPTRFFAELCKICLVNFKRWLRKHKINPYQHTGNKQPVSW
jgi:hypothetical protein